MNFQFRVPASTSNLGAGFDALSLALNRYLKIRVTDAEEFRIVATGISTQSIPTGDDNLILRVIRKIGHEREREIRPFSMLIRNEIPLARGMGSSAAAIIAGIACYEQLTGDPLSSAERFRYAFEFEPHPDNLAAALYGGLVSAAATEKGEALVCRLTVAPGASPLVIAPQFELSTARARAVLPLSYSRADAVYNVQRSALTMAALTTGRWDLLREAMRDRLHQPYRSDLIPGLEEILELKHAGLLGIALSGAGPTIFAFARPAEVSAVGRMVVDVFQKHGVDAEALCLEFDLEGLAFESC